MVSTNTSLVDTLEQARPVCELPPHRRKLGSELRL